MPGPPAAGAPVVDSPAPANEDVSRPAFIPLPLHPVWVTPLLLGVNLLLYLLLSIAADNSFFQALWDGANIEALVRFGAKENRAIIAGEYWRFLTPVFLHIGLLHLLFNQYALYLFGREVERLFGPFRFGALYLLAGLGGSLASFAFSPVVAAGASGAIFGIVGALILFFWLNRELLGEMGRQQARTLLTLLGFNLLLGLLIPGIDNFGHMGGLLVGLLLGALFSPRYEVQPLEQPPFLRIKERPSFLPAWAVAGMTFVALLVAIGLALPMAPVR